MDVMLNVLKIGAQMESPEIDSAPSGDRPMTFPGTPALSALALTTEPYRGTCDGPSLPPGQERWSMSLIKTADTSWFSSNGPLSVKEILPFIIDKITKWDEYRYLKKSMQVYGQQVPVRIFENEHKLRDGINRIAIAEIIGWDCMIISRSPGEKSMWASWDESEQGRKFHEGKAKRLGGSIEL